MVTLADHQIELTVNCTTTNRDKTGLSQMATTGSITGGTSTLVVANALDFRIGDWVIIEIGGEAGAGALGTKGVGGTYPALSYANAAARDADTTQVNLTSAWLEDTGLCYYWDDGGNVWVAIPSTQHYWHKAIPKALWAEITNVSGTTLTLSKTATVTATNANVYFDNQGIIQDYIDAGTSLSIPAGTYYVSGHNYIGAKPSYSLTGSGKTTTVLKSPNGASQGGIEIDGSDGVYIADMTIQENWGNTGYGFRWDNNRQGGFVTDELYRTIAYGKGIYFDSCQGGEVRNVKIIDAPDGAVAASYSGNIWAYNCTSVRTEPNRVYLQWQFGMNDSSSPGGFVDCDIDSAYLLGGFEFFQCSGGSFIRCSTINATWSFNTSDGTTMTDCSTVIEANSQYDASSFDASNPIINSNNNIGSGFSTLNNTIENFVCVQEGNINAGGDLLIGFTALSGTPDTDFIGTYPSTSNPKGLFDVQGAGGADGFDGLALRISGAVNVSATGMRFKGTQPDDPVKRHAYAEDASAVITLTNCVLDPGNEGSGTVNESGTLTNAEYEAL